MAALAALLLVAVRPGLAVGQPESALETLRRQVEALEERLEAAERQRREDAARIRDLESEVDALKASAAVTAEPGAPAAAGGGVVESAEQPQVGETERASTSPAATASPGMVERLNAFNPRITVFGNGLLRLDDRNVYTEDDGDFERAGSRFRLRETEVDLQAAIDPYADGVLVTAFEQEPTGDFETSVEEGYAVVKQVPFLEVMPLGLNLKLGRFRSEFGRLNRLHTHDLPQSTRPLAVKTFLGNEGSIADGASARLLLPTFLDDESAWELTTQVVQGGDVEVASDQNAANVLANLRWSRGFGDAHYADLAGIFDWGRTNDGGGGNAFTYSLDGLYKWKPPRAGAWRSALLGGQLFYSDRTVRTGVPGGPRHRSVSPFGYFVFGQYQLDRRLYAGVRWDWTQNIDDTDVRRMAVHPYATYYFSEFLRFRLGYEHRWSQNNGQDDLNTVFGEFNFVFGSHPPHPYWVNQ